MCLKAPEFYRVFCQIFHFSCRFMAQAIWTFAAFVAKSFGHENSFMALITFHVSINQHSLTNHGLTAWLIFFLVVQLVVWSWRVLLSLWWNDRLSLCAVEKRPNPTTSQLISIKMATTVRLDIKARWPFTMFPSPMKETTSAKSLELENQHRVCWLSEVRHIYWTFFYLYSSNMSRAKSVNFVLRVLPEEKQRGQ